MMRALQLTAIAAFGVSLNGQGVVAATHAHAGRRGLSFGDGHGRSLFLLRSPPLLVAIRPQQDTMLFTMIRRAALADPKPGRKHPVRF